MTRKPLAIHKGETHSPFQTVWWKPFCAVQKDMARSFKDMFSGTPLEQLMSAQEDIFEKLEDNISNVFAEVFNTRQMLSPHLFGDNTEPYIDIIENKDAFKVKAELPGVKEQDITIEIVEGGLQIEGEKYEECAEKGENYRHQECHAGYFCRTIALPEDADLEKAKTRFNLSTLTIEVPKKGQTSASSRKGRKLEVSTQDNKPAPSKTTTSKTTAQPSTKNIAIKAANKDKDKEAA